PNTRPVNGGPQKRAPPGPIAAATPEILRVKTLDSIGRVPSSPSLNVNRMAYNVTQFNEDYVPIPTTSAEKFDKFKPDLSVRAWTRRVKSLIPITQWLPHYNIRENLMAD